MSSGIESGRVKELGVEINCERVEKKDGGQNAEDRSKKTENRPQKRDR